MTRRIASVAALLAVLAPSSSAPRAEFYASSLTDLMKQATVVAVVRTDSTSSPKMLSGTVVQALEGSKLGDAVHYAPWDGEAPAFPVGANVLVICDAYLCPRALGVDRGGYYILEAYEPMDGAMVFPGLVTQAGLAALVSGRPAPPIVVHVNVHFQSDTGTERWDGQFDGGDGKGFANPAAIRGAPYPAHLTAGTGFPFWPGDYCDPSCDGNVAFVELDSTPGGIVLGGGPLTLAKDGSFAMDAYVIAPLARTEALFKRELAGHGPSSLVLFSGKVHITAGHKEVAAGDYPITISLDGTGEPHFTCSLFKEDTIGAFELDPSDPRIGFDAGSTPSWPQLSIDLGAIHPPGPCPGVAALLSASAPTPGTSASWPLEYENDDSHGKYTKVTVGTVNVTAAADPP
jgi:hypothetical protein